MHYSRIAIPLMLLCLAISTQAIDASGTVTVMKKGGKKVLEDLFSRGRLAGIGHGRHAER